jgi:hypothetical protein
VEAVKPILGEEIIMAMGKKVNSSQTDYIRKPLQMNNRHDNPKGRPVKMISSR